MRLISYVYSVAIFLNDNTCLLLEQISKKKKLIFFNEIFPSFQLLVTQRSDVSKQSRTLN